MNKLKVVVVAMFVVSLAFIQEVEAKGGGGRGPYSWEPKNPEERVLELLRKGPYAYGKYGWGVLAYHVPEEVKKIKGEINSELKIKLMEHASSMLQALQNGEELDSPSDLIKMKRALVFYNERVDFEINVDLNQLVHNRLVDMAKRLVCELKTSCGKKRGDVEENKRQGNILSEIDSALRNGVSLEEIGIASVDEMRDLANCRFK